MTAVRRPAMHPAGRLTAVLAGAAGALLAAVVGVPAAQAAASAQAGPSAEDAAAATYTGIYDEAVTLTSGRYEGEPFAPDSASRPTVGLVEEMQLSTDLDGDGTPERLVMLWENSGGSGTNLFLAAVAADRTGRATYIGNRIQVEALAVEEDLVRMDVLRAGLDDAMCCPGELATLRWRLGPEGLEVASDEVRGRLGVAAIAGDWALAFERRDLMEWLPEFTEQAIYLNAETGEPTTVASPEASPEVHLTLAGSTIGGRSGCNRVSGTAEFEPPNGFRVGPLMLTRMACPDDIMRLENEFIARLQNVHSVGYLFGHLALRWSRDGEYGTLLFDRAEQR